MFHTYLWFKFLAFAAVLQYLGRVCTIGKRDPGWDYHLRAVYRKDSLKLWLQNNVSFSEVSSVLLEVSIKRDLIAQDSEERLYTEGRQ